LSLFVYFSRENYGRIISGPWITNPLALPETTPEHTMAGVAPDGVVILSVLPVMFVNVPVAPVTVTPETVVNVAVTPVVVVPVNEVNVPVVAEVVTD
jgi:hypothetical protein